MSRVFQSLKFLLPVAVCVAVLGMAAPAFAQQAKTLGDMTDNVYTSLLNLQTFLSLLSYILGIYFSITGLKLLRDHVDDPSRNPLEKVLLRLGAAAFFIFAPTFANILVNTIGGGSVGSSQTINFSNRSINGSGSDGLDSALVRFVQDFGTPFLDNLLPYFAYAAGLVLMMVGLKRLALASGDGPQAPQGLGTMATFFVAAGLMAFGYIMFTIEGSIFGTTTVYSHPEFTGSAQGDLTESANRAMWGVFIFLRIVGYISVLRGLFMLRGLGEGQQVSMMAVSTHMIAGALLANGTGFVLMVQNTFIEDTSMHILK